MSGHEDSDSDVPQVDLRGNVAPSHPKQHGKRIKIQGKWKFIREKSDLPSIAQLKKQKRDTQRLLSRPTIPATLQIELERKLESLDIQLQEIIQQKREIGVKKSNYSKYKFVRFMERQKLTRRIKHLKKELESITDKKKRKELKQELKEANVELNYTLNYPLCYKYIALFPSKESVDEKSSHLSSLIKDQIRFMLDEDKHAFDTKEGAKTLEQRVETKLGKSLHSHHVKEKQDEDDEDVEEAPKNKLGKIAREPRQASKLQKFKAKNKETSSFKDDDFFMK